VRTYVALSLDRLYRWTLPSDTDTDPTNVVTPSYVKLSTVIDVPVIREACIEPFPQVTNVKRFSGKIVWTICGPR